MRRFGWLRGRRLRIGTWNLAAGSGEGAFLTSLDCDVLLLTEVSPDMKMDGYNLRCSQGVMACGQHFAVVATRAEPDCARPHDASVASALGPTTFMASVLPWRSAMSSDGFLGDGQGERTRGAVEAISVGWPAGTVVWGGDRNHELTGRLGAGAKNGRDVILHLLRERKLQVPTSVLGAEGGYGSIDHIAVPQDWKIMSVERHVAMVGSRRLSDHDAYVVEI